MSYCNQNCYICAACMKDKYSYKYSWCKSNCKSCGSCILTKDDNVVEKKDKYRNYPQDYIFSKDYYFGTPMKKKIKTPRTSGPYRFKGLPLPPPYLRERRYWWY